MKNKKTIAPSTRKNNSNSIENNSKTSNSKTAIIAALIGLVGVLSVPFIYYYIQQKQQKGSKKMQNYEDYSQVISKIINTSPSQKKRLDSLYKIEEEIYWGKLGLTEDSNSITRLKLNDFHKYQLREYRQNNITSDSLKIALDELQKYLINQ